MDAASGLSAVIVNWNSGSCLARLLESMEPLGKKWARVVVVDNGSQDGSARTARGRDGVELVEAGENLGFAGAANRGIARVATSWVLLLNPDVTLRAEAVETLRREADDRPRCGIATGTLLSASGRTPQIRSLPGPWSLLRDAVFLDELLAAAGLDRRGVPEEDEPAANDSSLRAVEVEQPAAAFWMLRRRAWGGHRRVRRPVPSGLVRRCGLLPQAAVRRLGDPPFPPSPGRDPPGRVFPGPAGLRCFRGDLLQQHAPVFGQAPQVGLSARPAPDSPGRPGTPRRDRPMALGVQSEPKKPSVSDSSSWVNAPNRHQSKVRR